MIDIDSLQVYVESAREHGFMSEICGMTYLQADELFARLRQAEKDAARYRWLRDKCSESNVSEIVLRDNWEMAIDEAMQYNGDGK